MQTASTAHEARMRTIAARPHTEVLEYVYAEQEREATPEMCVKLARACVERRQELPELSADEASVSIREKDPVLAQFSRTHPQIFRNMMDLQQCGQALTMLV